MHDVRVFRPGPADLLVIRVDSMSDLDADHFQRSWAEAYPDLRPPLLLSSDAETLVLRPQDA
jgi:hypothetical protein